MTLFLLAGFILSYSPLPVFSDKEWTLVRIQPHLYSYTVTDLISDRNYGVKMQAVNAKGYGPYSSTAEFYTGTLGDLATTGIPNVKGLGRVGGVHLGGSLSSRGVTVLNVFFVAV